MTNIHEYGSNEGNTHVETLYENVDEAMDTDQRQTLLGINQGKDLERLTSDFMNQKVSPNALAESQELVKLDNTLPCLKVNLRTAKLWLQRMDYIEVIKYFICCEKLGM